MSTARSGSIARPLIVVVLNASDALGAQKAVAPDASDPPEYEIQCHDIANSVDMIQEIQKLGPRREWILVCGSAPERSPPLSASTWHPVATEALALLSEKELVSPPRGLALVARTGLGRVSQIDIDEFEMSARRLWQSFKGWRSRAEVRQVRAAAEPHAMWFGEAGPSGDPISASGVSLVDWIESLVGDRVTA